MRTIYNNIMLRRMKLKPGKLRNEHDADREMIRCLQNFEGEQTDKMKELAQNVNEYKSLLEKNNLRDWIIAHGNFSFATIFINWILQILTLPVFLFGFLHNALPYYIAVKVASKIKDIQFQSSVKMAIGMIVFMIQLIAIAVPVFIFLPFVYSLLYLIGIPVSGWLAFNYYIWWKKNMAKLRFLRLATGTGNDKFRMIELRKQIILGINSVIDKYSLK
jgi:hypothetical protein